MPYPIYLDTSLLTTTTPSSCQSSKSSPSFPPKSTPSHTGMMERVAYVDALVDMNAMVIEAIWPNTQGPSSIVPLRCFIQEVLKRSRTTYSTLQTAFFYLFRARPAIMRHLQQQTSSTRPLTGRDAYIHCGRRMFLASLVVAAKFVQDKTYRNSAWANAAGLPVQEINTAERVFLGLLNYRLYVAQATFDQWHELLHAHVLAKSTVQLESAACLSPPPSPSLPALSPASSTSSSPLLQSKKRSREDELDSRKRPRRLDAC